MRKKNRTNNSSLPKRKKVIAFIFMSIIGFVLATLYYVSKPLEITTPIASPTGQLIETRQLLSPAFFVGDAAKAYQYAAEIPKVIDSLFCYCYCKKNHGHKTLLTCFTSNHGSKCKTCIGEVL